MRFDLVQFNNRMHGPQHSEEEEDYRKAVLKIGETIRVHAPNSTLVRATTTPLRNGKDVTGDTKAEYSDNRFAARNVIAAEILAKERILTLDINATVRGRRRIA